MRTERVRYEQCLRNMCKSRIKLLPQKRLTVVHLQMNLCWSISTFNVRERWIKGSYSILDGIFLRVCSLVGAERICSTHSGDNMHLSVDLHVNYFIPQNFFVAGNNEQWRKTTKIGHRWANQRMRQEIVLSVKVDLLINC